MIKHLSIVSVISLALISCFGEKHENELKEITSLRTRLTQTDSVLKNIDHEYAETKAVEVKNNSQFIQFNINKIGDTLDFNTGLFLNNYYSLLRGYQTVASTHEQIEHAIDSTRKNLDNLEHDINNNSLAEGLTPESCIEREKEQVNDLYQHALALPVLLLRAKTGYDTLAPKITNYMNELNIKLAAKQIQGK